MRPRNAIWLLCVGSLVLAGCADRHAGGTMDEIASAYAEALIDGAYATHLMPFVHPELRDALPNHPVLGNREPPPPRSIMGSELRSLEGHERESLERYFNFPVAPTHVLEFSEIVDQDVIEQNPLYLRAVKERYYVVLGLMKDWEEIEARRRAAGGF